MSFNFDFLLGIIERAVQNPSFQKSATDAIADIGKKILDNINAPDSLEKLSHELIKGAPQVVGAIVQGTHAEKLVDPAIVPSPAGSRD